MKDANSLLFTWEELISRGEMMQPIMKTLVERKDCCSNSCFGDIDKNTEYISCIPPYPFPLLRLETSPKKIFTPSLFESGMINIPSEFKFLDVDKVVETQQSFVKK
jgi:hypothetical protein